MKITKSQLRRIIKEEISRVIVEGPADVPEIGMSSGEDAMNAFVSREFEAGMNMNKFDIALEKFEVKFNIDYPDSIFKINDILEDMGDEGLAAGLRRLYQEEFDAREGEDWDEGEVGDGELSEPEARDLKALVGDAVDDALT